MTTTEEKHSIASLNTNQNIFGSNSSLCSKTTLFVRRIPYDATNSEFEEFFSSMGPLRSCFLVKDKEETNNALISNSISDDSIFPSISSEKITFTKGMIPVFKNTEKNKGFGFVQFVLAQDAEKALKELKKVKFRGKGTLKMEYATKKHEKPPEAIQKIIKRKSSPQDDNNKRKLIKMEFIEKDSDRTIVLQDLPKNLTRKKIYKKIRKFGYVQDMKFPNGENSTDIVHVIFKSVKDANDALLHLDGHTFHGLTMSAKLLSKANDKKGRLIVRNIPWQYREQELLKIFSRYGEVIEVNLPRKFIGGPLRGFAYIQYTNPKYAEKAIGELNETKHHGRTIAVDWALPKDKYLEAIGSRQIGKLDEERMQNNDSEEKGMGNDQEEDNDVEDEMEQDEDEQEEDNIINEGDDELQYEKQEVDDDMNYTNMSDNVSSVTENKIPGEVNDKEKSSEDESDVIETHNEVPKMMYPLSKGTVLFIRNLSFDATDEELSNIFRPFGPLRYCVITIDHQTGRSRGTGFVCFKQKEHAEACLDEARKSNQEMFSEWEVNNKKKKRKEIIFKSILTADPSDSLANKFTLHGRVLSIVKAVDRNEADKLTKMNQQRKRKEDKRNVYLMQEGVIFPNTKAAKLLTPSEVNKFVASYSMRKNLLAKNPNLYISKTRLSIRNLPLTIDENKLRILGKESIKKFKEEVESKERKDLTENEKIGWNKKVVIKQAKIVRAKDRIDTVTQKPRSKGYGFLEFAQHAHALAALRYLNNNPELFGEKKRLIVEFAVENFIIVKKRLARLGNNKK
ncbi:RNA-binding domain-containing protein [Rhizophagus irregularis]|uniref:RNA-binding domain-containing protein n=1 Tax=Rhizophagus irregularis TaxID=588596 RepID=A0A2I1GX74_9GLOM|nr:RNA-binding domain-containing protein [Rhizophagus irregularis]